MQLLYVWIENYKNIKEQGFNFSSEFFFEYDKETQELTIKDNPNYIENFFGENISNVTAIIGKNGSGKSSILNFLIDYKTNYSFLKKKTPKSFLIFSTERNDKKEIKYYFCISSPNINDKKSKIRFINDNEKDYHFIYFTQDIYNEILNQGILDSYFSNLSGSYLLNKFQYSTFRVKEDLNIIKVINKKFIKENKGIFNIPQYVFFDIERDYDLISMFKDFPSQILMEEHGIIDSTKLESKYKILLKYLEEQIKQVKYDDNLTIINIFLLDIFIHIISFSLNKPYNYIFIINSQEDIITNIKRTRFELETEKQNNNNSFFPYSDIIDLLVESLELYNFLIQKYNDKYILPNNTLGYFFNCENDYNDIKFILNKYDRISLRTLQKKRLKFSWMNNDKIKHKISSGEIAMLNFFARLNNCSREEIGTQRMKFSDDDSPTSFPIILMIDEIDLYFHPEWQKKIIFYITKILPELFHIHKPIQIILTSHSPFVISDLPKENIIFLNKDNEGICKVVNGLEDKKLTFAQNIHTLLMDSFFMKEGLIGDFAKSKIEEVIDWLQGDYSEIENNKGTIEKIINMIGEPVIRRKLQSMLNDRLEVNMININDKIKNLEAQIQRLKDANNLI